MVPGSMRWAIDLGLMMKDVLHDLTLIFRALLLLGRNFLGSLPGSQTNSEVGISGLLSGLLGIMDHIKLSFTHPT